MRRFLTPACALALAAGVWAAAPPPPAPAPARPEREAAWRENNLGVALLEQYRFADAAAAFRRALAADAGLFAARANLAIALFYLPDVAGARTEAQQALESAPDAPQPHYLLALIARSTGRPEEALPHLSRVLANDPRDVGANVTLGQVYLDLQRFDQAAAALEVALGAEPYNLSAAYNLGVALGLAGRREGAQAAMARYRELNRQPYKTALRSSYLEQGRYAEAVASTGAEPELVDPRTPETSFAMRDALALDGALPPTGATLALADLDGDGGLEAILVAGGRLRILEPGGGRLVDSTLQGGLRVTDALAALAGDYDNDGDPDLLVVHKAAISLFRNRGGGSFEDVSATAGLSAATAPARSAAFADVDHDGDLDLLAAGRLLRNNGNGTFTDVTAAAGLDGLPPPVAVVPTDFDNRRDVDLLWPGRERVHLLRNMRDGGFRDVAPAAGLDAAPGPFRCAAKADLDKDGFEDFLLCGGATSSLVRSDGRGGFAVTPAPEAAASGLAAQFLDYDNDGLLDLLVATRGGLRLLRNLGASFADVGTAAIPQALRATPLDEAALAVADLDRDGDPDVLLATPGRLVLLDNLGGTGNRSYAVRLVGRVAARDGTGAKVEIRAGSLRQRLETSAAVPMAGPAEVRFGLGARRAPDAIRVTWVSGTVQTEIVTEPGSGPLEIVELERKPSSCPYLYAWNGDRFEFVTDFLGAGEMGYRPAPGVVSLPDPVEYVRIAPRRLRPLGGRYELRVTNELEEVLYLDRLRLLAIDHPEDVLVFPDEGMTVPARPERLLAARDPRTPRAFDHRGRDVTERLRRADRVHVDDLPLESIRGYAERHALTLDLSALPASHTRLLLTGWTDYAFSSDNVAAHQAGLHLEPPRLEVEQEGGRWVTAVEQVGVPVGRPQTIVADVAGLLGPSRRARLVTSMRVLWDEIAAAVPADDVHLAPLALALARAELGERGFSAEAVPAPRSRSDRAREPDYARASWLSPWKTMPGRYTRQGDVRALIEASDDRFVIARPGDVLALAFDGRGLPALGRGFARTFLLHGDGFSKEMDVNSASPDAVQPLPYHGMESYPYDETRLPPAVRRVFAEQEAWHTRPALRPTTPIELFAAGASGKPD